MWVKLALLFTTLFWFSTGLARNRPVVINDTLLHLHVSSKGNDDWTGQLPEPAFDLSDGPLATVNRAVELLGNYKTSGAGVLTISIHQGQYVLRSPVNIFRGYSGNDSLKVLICPYHSDTVVLTTSMRLENIQRLSDEEFPDKFPESARGNVYRIRLKEQEFSATLVNGNKGMENLLIQDWEILDLTRYPSEGSWLKIIGIDKPANGSVQPGKVFYRDGNGLHFGRDPGIFAFGYWSRDWAGEHQLIDELDPVARSFRLKAPFHKYGVAEDQKFYFLNIMEQLDRPGRWFADLEEEEIYFWPHSPPKSGEVRLTVSRNPLIVLHDAVNVEIRGMVFNGCYGPAISIMGGRRNLINNCEFRNMATQAAVIDGGSYNGFENCFFEQIGAGAILLRGGDRLTLTPGSNFVRNCHISSFARTQKTYQGAIDIQGVGQVVTGNVIHDSPHLAIMLRGNEHLIRKNEIYDIALETGDAGAIYSLRDWSFRGNRIEGNFFHHIAGDGKLIANAVYLDDLMSGFTVSGNVFYKCAGGILVGGGRDNILENNVFIECDRPIYIDNRGDERARHLIGEGGKWRMHQKLHDVKYREAPWSEKYPELLNILEAYPGYPENNMVLNNVFYKSGGLRTKPGDKKYWSPYLVQDGNIAGLNIKKRSDFREMLRQLNESVPSLNQDFRPVFLPEWTE